MRQHCQRLMSIYLATPLTEMCERSLLSGKTIYRFRSTFPRRRVNGRFTADSFSLAIYARRRAPILPSDSGLYGKSRTSVCHVTMTSRSGRRRRCENALELRATPRHVVLRTSSSSKSDVKVNSQVDCRFSSTRPSYFQSCFTRVADMSSRRRLRSSGSERLHVPVIRRSTVGSRTFTVSGAAVWNDLPAHVTAAFRQRLKTFLFSRSYPGIVI